MNTQKKGISTYDIVAIALMAAFVFVAAYFFKIDLPTIGGKTSIKLGNGICILAALLLGGYRLYTVRPARPHLCKGSMDHLHSLLYYGRPVRYDCTLARRCR